MSAHQVLDRNTWLSVRKQRAHDARHRPVAALPREVKESMDGQSHWSPQKEALTGVVVPDLCSTWWLVDHLQLLDAH